MVTAEFDVTDRLWVFGRYSYLNDADWLIYGEFQKLYECSFGVGYKLFDHVEIRAELRHDRGTDTGSTDSASIHVTAGF
jgi:hypothetical protein